jgi:poly(3-hydroxybutyrate) depolymerase
MKNLKYLIPCLVLFLLTQSFGQSVRYRDEVFSAYTLTSNIQYGTTTTQMLDYYVGTGDTATNRPVILFIHGGGFTSGDKVSNFGTLECSGFAKRGYFVVSINYRLSSSTSTDKAHFEAMIKALQDAKAAVRFLRKNFKQYGIDTTKIFAAGSSAGSITALHLAYLQDSEVPSYVDLASLGGNLEGSMGNPGYTSNIQGVISNWGALADYKWMAGNPIPVYCVHGTSDVTVPCDSSFGDGPFKYGSIIINNYAQTLGYPTGIDLFTGAGHTLDNNSSLQTQAYKASAAWLYSILVNPSAPLTITSPIGGEVWQQGMSYPITWVTNGVSSVNLDYSTDSGTSWSNIAKSVTASLGEYAWTVPSTLSTTCLVKVSNAADSAVKSVSSSVFTISAQLPPALTLLFPVGGDSLAGGVSQNITWTSTNVTGAKIELSTDAGSSWSTVAAAAAAASGSFKWSVPNISSNQCLIKVSDTSNASLFSQSLNTFTITKTAYVKALLLEENFVPPTDTSKVFIGTNGWAAVTGSTTGTQLAYVDSNLTFGVYPSKTGKAIQYTAGGTSKAFKNITLPVADAVYLSFLIKVPTAAQTQANHVIGFGAGDMTTLATYSLKTYCKWNATTLGYTFGTTSGSTATYNTTAPTSVPAGTTALVILKYDIVGNTADLFVFIDPASYPTNSLPATPEVHLSSVTAFMPSCIYMRSQGGSSGTTASCIIDGIRCATYWGDLATKVEPSRGEVKAKGFELNQNYPNPFNPSTVVNYNIPNNGHVTLSVMNILGEEMMRLVDEDQNAGLHQVHINAAQLPSGVYLYRLTAGNYSVTKKMMLLK